MMNPPQKSVLKTIALGFLALLISSSICFGQSKTEQLDQLLNQYLEYGKFNGSVLVADEGVVVYKKGFGYANMEWDIPNQADTKFRLASITKPFTAILIMQLVAKNKLDLHKPITTYLPDYPKDKGDQITIHHLLTHTSGTVRDYEDNAPKNKYPDRQRLDQLVAKFSDLPLEFKPGERFTYSNSGYLTLGYIIETVTGKSFESVLQQRILSPLNMKNTGVDKHRPILKNRAKGYFKGFGDYFNSDYVDMSSISAVGNMYSTGEDMFLLDQALHDESLLSKKYRDLMFYKHIETLATVGIMGTVGKLWKKPLEIRKMQWKPLVIADSLQGFVPCSPESHPQIPL